MHAHLSNKLSTDERVAALLQARTVLQVHGCHVGAPELVNRELDLLNRCIHLAGICAFCGAAASFVCICILPPKAQHAASEATA